MARLGQVVYLVVFAWPFMVMGEQPYGAAVLAYF
jgi:hypothetical protein